MGKNIHLLGVIGSEMLDIETKQQDYSQKLMVPDEVYSWLLAHDVKIDSDGSRIFICNNIQYKDLGLKFD